VDKDVQAVGVYWPFYRFFWAPNAGKLLIQGINAKIRKDMNVAFFISLIKDLNLGLGLVGMEARGNCLRKLFRFQFPDSL